MYSSRNIPKFAEEGTPPTHSMRLTSPKYKNQTKISHKKRKSQAQITGEQRFKNSQQNIGKPNSTMH